jgi:hypothetical protein
MDDNRDDESGDLELRNDCTISRLLEMSCSCCAEGVSGRKWSASNPFAPEMVLELSVVFRPTPDSLEDMIGPRCGRSWKEDFCPASREGMQALGQNLQVQSINSRGRICR